MSAQRVTAVTPFPPRVRLLFPEIPHWTVKMLDEYTFLRRQYEAIIEHTNYLLRSADDLSIVDKAYETRARALRDLQRLNFRLTPYSENA